MSSTRLTNRAWWSMVGAATAATGIVASLAPVAHAAPANPTDGARDNALRADAADRADGTYESCAAYFGFGKWSNSVLDVVSFDVGDRNGADGVTHAVPTDTQVVFELTNDEGDTLECTPPEVTEAEWNEAMDDLDIYLPPGRSFPAWPGPGHYGYPSLSLFPYIADFGSVTAVAFKVTAFPGGHGLDSPTGLKPLVQHFPIGFDESSTDHDPRLLAFITAQSTAAASAAFANALDTCAVGDDGLVISADLPTAVQVLVDYYGIEPLSPDDFTCRNLGRLNTNVSYLLALDATVTYTEPIVLSLPEPPVTTTPTTSPATTPPPAIAAQPIRATPRYTG